jgi:hypothetical protein
MISIGQCFGRYNIQTIVPMNSEDNLSEVYILDSHNLTKRPIKGTRSKIIYKSLKLK